MAHEYYITRAIIEFIYTSLIVLLCFYVDYKTKEIYELTKHKGIKYFRNAFLFFGLSYGLRFMVLILQLGLIVLDKIIPRRYLFPIILPLAGYLVQWQYFILHIVHFGKKYNIHIS